MSLVFTVVFCKMVNVLNKLLTGLYTLASINIPHDNGCSAPANVPNSMPLYKSNYRNWAGEISGDGFWTAAPKSPDDVVMLSNWAYKNGYKLRPSGFSRNWSPLVITNNSSCNHYVLVDTRQFLTSIEMVATTPPTVRVQTGLSMEDLLVYLETHGYAMAAHPAPGDISVGGVLATDGHGVGIPLKGQDTTPGMGFGSISNLVVSLKVVVWNNSSSSYEMRTFLRHESETSVFLTSLGRTFLIEVTLRVVKAFNLQCISHTDISIDELLQHPSQVSNSSNSMSNFLDVYGRVEIILFPFTEYPWLKLWKEAPSKPPESRQVSLPYNYVFTSIISQTESDLIETIQTGAWELTPTLGLLQYNVVKFGLIGTASADIWGPAKNLLLYIQHSTLRITISGHAILVERYNIQLVLHKIYKFYKKLMQTYSQRDLYPITGPLEIRITGLDTGEDMEIPNAQPPSLSACQPESHHPEFNTVIWIDAITFPSTPSLHLFLSEYENFLFNQLPKELDVPIFVRPEWSKGWAYTKDAAWANRDILTAFPKFYRETWSFSVNTFNKYDPFRIFSNGFLDEVLQIR